MDRKYFLKLASLGAVCGGILPLLEGCATYRYVDSQQENGHLKIAKTAFQEDQFVLVRNPQATSPIYLRKKEDGSFRALLLECTHKQCSVNPSENRLSCPCHGSQFDATGNVLEGPAKKNLFAYRVNTDPEYIYIELPN